MTDRILSMKPSAQNELFALDAKVTKQILDKLKALCADPMPDAKVKKKLKHLDRDLYRLRSGDYRIFYLFDDKYVSVLKIDKRAEDTYDSPPESEHLGGLDAELPASTPQKTWPQLLAKPEKAKTKLISRLTEAMLKAQRVPDALHEALLDLKYEEELLAFAKITEDQRLALCEMVNGARLEDALRAPDLIVDDTDDLLRIRAGELVPFLLRLDPVQESAVKWGLASNGPTLLKGGPGSGKSTVALYRCKAIVDRALKEKQKPSILFTTYTNALVAYSQQLLKSLLGEHADLVTVRTADSVARQLAEQWIAGRKLADGIDLKRTLERAVKGADYDGNAMEQAAQREAIAKLQLDYLLEEITAVIQARNLDSLAAYLAAKRAGRELALSKLQRRAVWTVTQTFHNELAAQKAITWQMLRAEAARVAEHGPPLTYDAVIIDEAQDLEPTAIRMLVHLCKQKARLFLTADANQSIYGGAFRWADVHETLSFKGHTHALKVNYRSTKQLALAAKSYLEDGALDDDESETPHAHEGFEPAVRKVKTPGQEETLLANFIRNATRELRLGIGGAAVLCPTEASARRVAMGLNANKVPAAFMKGKELDLKASEVKVLTMKSAKGLEFPVVMLAGFVQERYPPELRGAGDDEEIELLRRERRTIFVAMTRAMRALLVVLDAADKGPLFQPFDKEKWNLTSKA
ncbi:MAG: UvrD-helicase domain-containing protein [Deltaproteobacteria bacterium]|nr:UvrD-helicase domain-containing protein [Deltaproteobacteria bacterium]